MLDKKTNAHSSLALKMGIALFCGVLFGIIFLFMREFLIKNGYEHIWNVIDFLLFKDITLSENTKAIGLFFILGQLFINCLQFIIVPLIFSSIVLAILRRIGEETKIRRYGDPNYNNREKYVETMVSSYGVHNSYQLPEVRKKIDREKASETKRKNKTFNSSNQEDHLYQILTELYGKNDILRQYKDKERYPWACDFYIKSLDLFIELQGFFTHGGHPFDETNYEDLQRKAELEEKWNHTKSKLYIIALNVWCNTDIKKRNLAKENNLNYIEIFKLNVSKEEVQNLIKSYFKGTNSGILI